MRYDVHTYDRKGHFAGTRHCQGIEDARFIARWSVEDAPLRLAVIVLPGTRAPLMRTETGILEEI